MTADHTRRPTAGGTTRRCEPPPYRRRPEHGMSARRIPPPYRGRCALRSGLR
ncbi:hypothetical protein OG539_33390 [Actinacidiphila glaucinigra]|uniref:hypothetical protein n=1 Tax=Actinacidiphila glaucinigra TaxID=235986 RepID=UPI003255F51B